MPRDNEADAVLASTTVGRFRTSTWTVLPCKTPPSWYGALRKLKL